MEAAWSALIHFIWVRISSALQEAGQSASPTIPQAIIA